MAHKAYGLNELREMYLKFFESKGHLRLPSFSLVPQNDKSILLINAGMTPMKPWFTGEEEPPRHRVTTCQKCIRTGDIENVGHTARHGTYFEMLGNFSFGDYFKKEAIPWAWEFLTSPEWVGLEPDRLYPSVFAGNETTPADDEAFAIWRDDIGIPENRIFRFGKEDNFWEHGSGPCGPCSEIYYDRGAEYGCGKPGCTVGCDCDRYVEVWNIVFSQFNNDGHGHYEELKQKNIDTGMGLERLACVCQNVNSLFDVDTVMNITNKVSELTGAHYGESQKTDVSLRVITDHIRSSTFMICDGILPSNEGRGYVLRRLLRRAARHGKLLGVNEPFLYRIVDTVIHENECQYPELREKQAYITRVIRTEEENFAKTIDGGMKIFSEMLENHKAKGETVFSGADAFKLYDTYGFPIDLTNEMVKEVGLSVDEDAFRQLMQEQKVRAREARKALGDLGWAGVEFGKEIPATEFVGYTNLESDAKIVAIVAEDELRDAITAGQDAILVLDRTPFYAEMGGQVADHGVIFAGDAKFAVSDVQKNKGGKYQCQEISAKKGIGISDLMEKVLLEAEMLDLKANPNRKATGSIIESSLDKGRGYVSTVLVSNGTLRVGDNIIAGTSWGRIKAMFNERNQRIQSAGPAEPAIILGLNGAPTAGDSFHVLETEQEARDIANKRLQLQREQGLRTQKRLTLSDISHRIALGSFKELNIIVKGDTDGSIEALSDSFIKMSTEKIKVDVIYKAVGQISESDVTLADASDAIIVGFQVRPSAAARKLAEQEGVEINTYSVIYDAIDDVKSAMIGMLDKVKKEVITGQVEVREVYKISKVGTVAGCYVTEGKVHRVDRARVIRDGIVVHTADIAALKRYKDDVKEVATNFECGISLVNFNDIQQGDVLETFTEIEVKQTL